MQDRLYYMKEITQSITNILRVYSKMLTLISELDFFSRYTVNLNFFRHNESLTTNLSFSLDLLCKELCSLTDLVTYPSYPDIPAPPHPSLLSLKSFYNPFTTLLFSFHSFHLPTLIPSTSSLLALKTSLTSHLSTLSSCLDTNRTRPLLAA